MRSIWVAIPLLASATYLSAQAPPGRGSSPAAPKPDQTRFQVETLVPGGELEEPMVFTVAKDGRAYIAERHGGFKVYQPATGTTKTIAKIPVFDQNEQGFIGISADPNFLTNRWIYAYFADPAESRFRLVRWQLTPTDELVAGAEKTLLEIPADRAGTNHTGGGMTWDARGNLYLTVGNNTGNSQFMQSDERPGRQQYDDQRGAANSNDLRGKILRIHPEANGTYTIPSGNMFPPGTANTRPEIYTMGHRNVWRVSVDSRTGDVFWGEIGPDQADDTATGTRGYDEFNRARRPGFFGWPYFVGDNQRFRYANYVDNSFGDFKDPERPINASVNNTGIRELPPAQKPLLWYPFAVSDAFPEVASGARCAVGGPLYRRADFTAAARPWPAYYEGKWIITDCTRAWIKSVTFSDGGQIQGIEDIVSNLKIAEPMDMKFGPDGDLYVLDYGSLWNAKSPDSKLVRVKYLAGNRAPIAVASSDTRGGTPPFQASLAAKGSQDYDGDPLTYSWVVTDGRSRRVFRGAAPSVPFTQRGVYTATLTVTDARGSSSTDELTIVAGNEAPTVRVNLTGNVSGNAMFFAPNTPLPYSVEVIDREDGRIGQGIDQDRVAFSIEYVTDGVDLATLRQGTRAVDAGTRHAFAQALMASSDCRACHQPDMRMRGPSLKELSTKYLPDAATLDRLAAKVRSGGTGVWGAEVMPAHPAFTMHEARTLVGYMLDANSTSLHVLPLSGTYAPVIPNEDDGRGMLVMRAVYTDRGADGLPAQTSEAVAYLRAGVLAPQRAAMTRVAVAGGRGGGAARPSPNSVMAFKGVDLTGVARIGIAAQAQAGRNAEVGGDIEIRSGALTGPVLGRVSVPVAGGGRGAAAPVAAQTNAAAVRPTGGPLDGQAGGAGRGAAPAPAREGGAGAAAVGGGGRGVVAAGPAEGGGRGRAGGAGLAPLVRLSTPIAPTPGVHDLYLVFRNDAARPNDILMTVSDIALIFAP